MGLVAALGGCQRLDEENSPSADVSFDTDPFAEEDSSDSLLQGASEDGSDDGGMEFGCNPVTSAECGVGEKCTAVLEGSSPSFACVGETGTQGIGESCDVSLDDGLDGCTLGSVCLGDEAGTCRPLCNSATDCTSAQCLNDPIHGVPHCAADCSPFEPTCAGALQCRRQSDRFSCVDALPGDVGGEGDPCELQSDAGCGEGLMCIPGALVPGCTSGGCCVSLCDLDSVDPCDAPATCNNALEAPAPGFESIGACFVPA